MEKKRAFLVIILLAVLLLPTILSSVSAANDDNDKGLWDLIKTKTSNAYGNTTEFLLDKFVYRVIGVSDISGEETNILSGRYWTEVAWQHALFGLAIGLWMILFNFIPAFGCFLSAAPHTQ